MIDALCEKFGIAINWTSENVIPYVETLCRKLVTYEILTSAVNLVLWLTLGIVCVLLIKKFYPKFRDGVNADKEGWIVGSVFTIIGLIIFYIVVICVTYCQVEDIIKCTIFPEMYVIEYIGTLVNAG